MEKYQIESRYPSWAKWRKVAARPHGENYLFDEKGYLYWHDIESAYEALKDLKKWNSGEFRIVGII